MPKFLDDLKKMFGSRNEHEYEMDDYDIEAFDKATKDFATGLDEAQKESNLDKVIEAIKALLKKLMDALGNLFNDEESVKKERAQEIDKMKPTQTLNVANDVATEIQKTEEQKKSVTVTPEKGKIDDVFKTLVKGVLGKDAVYDAKGTTATSKLGSLSKGADGSLNFSFKGSKEEALANLAKSLKASGQTSVGLRTDPPGLAADVVKALEKEGVSISNKNELNLSQQQSMSFKPPQSK